MSDDKTLTARDVIARECYDGTEGADDILNALIDAGYEIAPLGALAEAQQRIEAVKELHTWRVFSRGGMVTPAHVATVCMICDEDFPCPTVRALSSSTAPETPQDDALLAAAQRRCSSCGRPAAECRNPDPFLSCCNACRANDGDTHRPRSTAPETGIGARQWGVNAVSGPEMGSTAPETPTKQERCYHPSSWALPGGKTQCRTCFADTTHVDAMGG